MAKLKIHQFDPVIYPRNIYVVKGEKIGPSILESFRTEDDEQLCLDGSDGCRAGVWAVRYLDGKHEPLGVLVWLRCKIDVSVIAHESVHAANQIFTDCGVNYNALNDEHFAHLVVYIAKCLCQVHTGKFNDE